MMFGFLKRGKEEAQMIKGYAAMWKDVKQQRKAHLQMSAQELTALSDEELCEAVSVRTDEKIGDDIVKPFEEYSQSLTEEERTFYICRIYDEEVDNGGLCQYFVNSSRESAPLLSDSLAAIGASEHQQLFEAFVRENHINLNDLDSFVTEDIEDYAAQAERYPFDDFDDRFVQLPPLDIALAAYIREHIEQFS